MTDVQVLASCVGCTRGRWWCSNQGQRNIVRGSAGQSPWLGTRHAPRKSAQPSKARRTEPAPWSVSGWGHPGRGHFVDGGVSSAGYGVLSPSACELQFTDLQGDFDKLQGRARNLREYATTGF